MNRGISILISISPQTPYLMCLLEFIDLPPRSA
jgi:hypothetical protein